MTVVGAVFFAADRGDCSRGIFNCWLLLVLYLLLPVAATALVVFLIAGWGIDESIADIFSSRS